MPSKGGQKGLKCDSNEKTFVKKNTRISLINETKTERQ